MSRDLDHRLKEDRALRNAAKALVKADMDHLRSSFNAKSMGERFTDRVSAGAVDVFEEAVDVADSNRGALTALIAAVLLWFARNPIMALFSDDEGLDDETGIEDEPDAD